MKNWKSKQKKIEDNSTTQNYELLGRKFTINLYWISVLRYLAWIIRGIIIVLAGGFKIKLWAVVFIIPIVQLAMLLSFTPANLGLMELSWVGLLALFHVPNASAIEFALLQRFLYVVSTVIALGGFLFIWSIEHLFKLNPAKK